MAKRRSGNEAAEQPVSTIQQAAASGLQSAPQALVFISHDSHDADLAEEFDNTADWTYPTVSRHNKAAVAMVDYH